jgi:hypothetical protein
LSEMARRNGVGHELARAASEEFVWRLLNQPERTWEYSSLTALLAALGEFGTILAILENLSNFANPTSLQSVNFAAISASFEALCLSRPPLELREVFLRLFLKLVDRLDSQEFTRFRSVAIQSAIIFYAKLARFDPFWLQDEFLAFVETQYATVPEFWTSLRSSLGSEPSNDFIARLYSIGEAADQLKLHFDNLRFLADGGPDSLVQSPAILAAPRRKRYFETLNAIHWPDGRSNAKELLREDTFIVRLLALPPAFVPRKLASSVQPQRVRDCVQRLQKYPRSRYNRLLDDLGNAALRLDFTKILRALDDFELIDFRDDAPSEAVVVDILCWAVLTSEPSANNTARLVEILERWVMALSPNVASHVDLPSI